jgi:hypothetical protein
MTKPNSKGRRSAGRHARRRSTAVSRDSRAFAAAESGQGLAEYAIACAVVAVGIGLIAVAIGANVNALWAAAAPVLAAVAGAV